MFTGIVEEVGFVAGVRRAVRATVLEIGGLRIFGDLRLGDSVSVEGVCLTVAGLTAATFTSDVMNETLARSTLGGLAVGHKLNLERAMPANGRFGGHIVTGHIDGTGLISNIFRDDNAIVYTITTSPELVRYVVEKGSIAIDGISLTVTGVWGNSFGVSVIPHTAQATTLASKPKGAKVNLENDILGKYVEKMLMGRSLGSEERINMALLAKHGFGG